MSTAMLLSADRSGDVIDVFADAFRDYPVMRWVVGPEGDVPLRVRRLIELFVVRRVMRGGPMFGVFDGDRLVGASILTVPVEPDPPSGITALADAVWRDLGEPARERYLAYAASTSPFFSSVGPHHHLNMIGICASHAGRGLARPLLEAVHAMAHADPLSAGVSLTTELARNVTLYEHFGYGVIAHGEVGQAFETWGLLKPTRESLSTGTSVT